MSHAIKVGDLFVRSWGYDQTNVDFYQVVRVSEKCYWVRKIAAKPVPGTAGFMCHYVTPDKDNFLAGHNPEQRVRAASYLGRPTTVTDKSYESWYA